MIIVISPEKTIKNEINHVKTMLDHGLDLFHFRKYGMEKNDAINYLAQLNPHYLDRIVLHTHHNLIEQFNINKLHFNSMDRKSNKYKGYLDQYTLSTSTHSISEFNNLGSEWNYAFISPLFPSISKSGYGNQSRLMEQLISINNKDVHAVGLGGIHRENMNTVLQNHLSVALMGSIWNQSDPTDYFLSCKRTADCLNII